jgi:predicted peroxiredoxin
MTQTPKRTTIMKKFLIAALAAAGLAGPALAQEQPETLVTILTAPEPQTQLMAMVLAMQAAQQGVDPHILLCGPAGDMALKDAPDSVTAPQPPMGMSPQGLMAKIAEMPDATVEVCALYLPGMDADASVLIDGVTVAKPPAMAGAMIAPGARVASY